MVRAARAAWGGRIVVAVLLISGAIWWSGTRNFAGTSYCEQQDFDACDGFGVETLAPWVLWPLTVFATLLVGIGAALAAPSTKVQRLAWAALIGAPVFVLNRHQLVWASVATGLVVTGAMSGDGTATGRRVAR